MGQLELLYLAGGDVESHNHFGKIKLNVCLFCDPEIPLLSLYTQWYAQAGAHWLLKADWASLSLTHIPLAVWNWPWKGNLQMLINQSYFVAELIVKHLPTHHCIYLREISVYVHQRICTKNAQSSFIYKNPKWKKCKKITNKRMKK